jgi:hypothetical protein
MNQPKAGLYYAQKTLLSSEPDCNRRYIYQWPDSSPIALLNVEMRVWTSKDEEKLQAIIKFLNELS